LVAFIRGAILPYFAKRGNYRAYIPQEEKRAFLQGFPVPARAHEKEKEPLKGLFSLREFPPILEDHRRGKRGYQTPFLVISPTIC
jgi:hypothetical protein